jgi:hypothetical protein
MTDLSTSFDPDSILDEARARTGFVDFGDDSFREPMRRLLSSMDEEGKLHEIGRMTQRERVIGLLVNRLRAEAAITRHPEILDEELREPLVIVGLARTGTTMLQRTIAADPRMFALRWWESRHPAPFSLDEPESGPDPRITAAEEEVRMMVEAVPELFAVHPFDAHAPDEEIMLVEHSFLSTNPAAFVHVPSYIAWLNEQDQRPAYDYLMRLLRLVQWQKKQRGEPGERWVLKTPTHLHNIDLLFEVMPDAKVVQTHRDPLQTIPSLASFCHMVLQTGSDQCDPKATGRMWGELFRSGIEKTLDFRASAGAAVANRFLDLRYEDLIADSMAQIQVIYDFIGMELTLEARTRMQEWAVENSRDKRPVHRYTVEEFGFSEAGLARDFERYRQHFQ